MEDKMVDRFNNLIKGGCAICGVKSEKHKSKYNKDTGVTTDFTHYFDGGDYDDFIFRQNNKNK